MTFLPKVEVVTTKRPSAVEVLVNTLGYEAERLLRQYPPASHWEPTAVAEFLRQRLSEEHLGNAVSSHPLQVEDSSGNFTVAEDERGLVLQTYRHDGGMHETVLTRAAPSDTVRAEEKQ